MFNCNSSKENILKMSSFRIIDTRDFEMCFNENIEGKYYSITIVTKSGRIIEKGGVLVLPKNSSMDFCFKEQKMQYSFRAYDEEKTKFYEDSIINKNIAIVKWEVYTKDYKKPIAIGEYKF